MKHLNRPIQISLRSLCLAGYLCLAGVGLAGQVLAKEMKPAPEPLHALPASTELTDFSETEDHAPLLLLAQAASSKAEAAQIAKSRYGGKVLSVRKSGNGWQVKLLLDDGRVKMVFVEGSGADN